jgi:hypothetical protein
MSKKFRPYFTSQELSIIISCLKKNPTPETLAISKYLETFNIKINTGIIQSQLTLAPTMEEKLGFIDTQDDDINNPNRLPALRLAAYLKWQRDPKSVTILELSRVMQYRYENDLMTQEEEIEYEKKFMV